MERLYFLVGLAAVLLLIAFAAISGYFSIMLFTGGIS